MCHGNARPHSALIRKSYQGILYGFCIRLGRLYPALQGKAIDKSVFTEEYEVFLRLLRETRQEAQLTQRQMAERLEHHQAFVSRSETGERRLDVIELRVLCKAMGVPFRKFIDRLEAELEKGEVKTP
jgi:ribosome-binding protein aMBF1 (putative translation factor)